jgi:hypothetical protein
MSWIDYILTSVVLYGGPLLPLVLILSMPD